MRAAPNGWPDRNIKCMRIEKKRALSPKKKKKEGVWILSIHESTAVHIIQIRTRWWRVCVRVRACVCVCVCGGIQPSRVALQLWWEWISLMILKSQF